MTKKMLIDAAQSEEIRVAVTDGKKVEDFDFESAGRKPLRGNIYLARVTRVEPSLQAAFVEYGGNRHGFLAFSEIHPDYYQIPVSDREVLQAAERKMVELADELEIFQRGDDVADEEDGDISVDDGDSDDEVSGDSPLDEEVAQDRPDEVEAGEDASEKEVSDNEEAALSSGDDADGHGDSLGSLDADYDEDVEGVYAPPAALEVTPLAELSKPAEGDQDETQVATSDISRDEEELGNKEGTDDEVPENVTAEGEGAEQAAVEEEIDPEAAERAERRAQHEALVEKYKEARRNHSRILKNYKIQEVIKPRQILLVQVVKEERGNKGAALTSYMSLAGRYCVLMPNTARGGGISRKIPNAADRKRLRRIVNDFDVKQGMGLIIRTAGAKRTKTEIKRDFDYLLRLWDTIRELTMESVAPCLIYEEASLIKRAIRDLYDKDISKVLVEGEDGYKEAKGFMKMLMPSHAKNVQPYKDETPLFIRYDVEQQLDMMYQPAVRLKSGGYLVIHQTEALIAVDVNSGKATRERNIEATALKTNLEAAQEVARQCKLRDLAGLIVIDFIDMEETKNNRSVERKLKDAMKTDRARIQIGRISGFGLLEMSRQRRRSGIVDGTTNVCPTCSGSGAVRSHEMAALRVLRAIEAEAISGRAAIITAKTSMDVTLYILNHKRDWLNRIETQYALRVEITADPQKAGDLYEISKRGAPRGMPARTKAVQADFMSDVEEGKETASEEARADGEDIDEDQQEQGRKRRRRRRRRRGEAGERNDQAEASESSDADDENQPDAENTDTEDGDEEKQKKRRRRGRRGGRKRREANAAEGSDQETSSEDADTEAGAVEDVPSKDQPAAEVKADNASDQGTVEPSDGEAPSEKSATPPSADEEPAEKPKKRKRKSTRKKAATKETAEKSEAADASVEPVKSQAAPEPEQVEVKNEPDQVEAASEKPKKKKSATRKGWWQRAIGG